MNNLKKIQLTKLLFQNTMIYDELIKSKPIIIYHPFSVFILFHNNSIVFIHIKKKLLNEYTVIMNDVLGHTINTETIIKPDNRVKVLKRY